MALNFVITNVGKAAIAQAGTLGPVVLSTIQVGNAGYTPSPTQTALQAPIKSLTPSGFSNPSSDTIHFTVSDETTDTYTCQEIGIITSTGILFAVYSQASPIVVKVSTTAAFFAIDLAITGIPPGSYTLGGTGFSYPPASETVKGVAFLATQSDVDTGTDALKIITPARLRATVFTTSQMPVAGIEYPSLSDNSDYTKNTKRRVNSASINFDPAFLEATGGSLVCTAGAIPANGTIAAATGSTLAVTALSDLGTWTMTNATTFEGDRFVGMIFKIVSISGTANATLGGANVSTLGVRITRAISATQLEFKMLSGAATTTQNGVTTFTVTSDGVRSSYGCSLTRLAAFDYRLTFTTPFTDTSYSWTGSVGTASTGSLWIGSPALPYNQWKTPASLRFRAVSATGTVATNIMNDISIVVTATR
jgi:hypothetical protein